MKNTPLICKRNPMKCPTCKKQIKPDRTSVTSHNKSCSYEIKGFYNKHVKRTLTCPKVGCGAKIAPLNRTHKFWCKATIFLEETERKTSKEDEKKPP